ncbi:hypothetical protein IQ287_28485 [Burkholderia sp. R-69927]|nr:hypothetical protein [Burkholderia sp. R-69927]
MVILARKEGKKYREDLSPSTIPQAINRSLIHLISVRKPIYLTAVTATVVRQLDVAVSAIARQYISSANPSAADSTGQRNTQRFCQLFSSVHKSPGLTWSAVQARGNLAQGIARLRDPRDKMAR